MTFVINCSTFDAIIYGIPNSLLFTILCYHNFNINLWQFMYFNIMCYYLKIKIKEQNKKISLLFECNKIRNINLITKAIRSMNSLYLEINDYNINYWSKYLL